MTAALTIDGLGVAFRRLQGGGWGVADHRGGGAAGAAGRQWRRQDDADGPDLRQDARARRARVHLYDIDITNWEEPAIARAGHRAQIPDPERVPGAERAAQPGGGGCRKPGVFANLRFGLARGDGAAARRGAGDDRAGGRSRAASPAI